MTDANGAIISQTKYKAWGEVRQATGTSPTNYTYTGQYSYTADFGLMYYNARWYDPALGRFAQADTIVPGGVQGLDRYAYVNNSPLNYVDPSGHVTCNADGFCGFSVNRRRELGGGITKRLLTFAQDEGETWTDGEKQAFEGDAWDVANALARDLNIECRKTMYSGEGCNSLLTPLEAFYQVFGGSITVRRKDESESCGCWAMHQGKIDGHYEIWVYSTTTAQDILSHPRLGVHEIGHAFYWAAGGFVEGSSVGGRNGFFGPYYQWQFGHDSPDDLGTEIFADMFVGWVYGKWEKGYLPSGLSINGQYKSDYMEKYMPLMINQAMGR